MTQPIQFFVPGLPQPGGSKKGFVHRTTGRVIITEDNKRSKDWRAVVAHEASRLFETPFSGPVQVRVVFQLPRPKGHFRTGVHADELRPTAPAFPTTRPDCTKLWRSTEDSLKHIAWMDDSQVVRQDVRKVYGKPGAWIEIREATTQ